MRFRDIIGQDEVKKHLVEMYAEGRVPHAMMLHGREGAGALALAIAFAQYQMCTGDKSAGDSCGECHSCKQFAKLSHPDLHFIFPIIKKDSGGGDSDMFLPKWREMFEQNTYFDLTQWLGSLDGKKQGLISRDDAVAIHQKLRNNPYEASVQILIMWHPELMNDTASNRILKILEEPPKRTMFILVGDSTSDLLPTILSRTQVMRVPAISDEAMKERLTTVDGLSAEQAERITHIACGDYIRARQAIEGAEEMKANLDFFTNLMRICYSRNVMRMISFSDSVRDFGREGLKTRLAYSLNMIRQNFVMNLDEERLVFMTAEEEAFSKKFAPFVHVDNVLQLSELIGKALAHVEQNGNERIIMMDLMMQMAIELKKPHRVVENDEE